MNDPAQGRDIANIWSTLRRRKVVQWGIAYAASAWVLLQVLEYFSGTFDWPRQIQQLTTVALLIGLPVALILAWYHGDRGEQRIRGTELAIIALLFVVGGGILWLYDRGSETTVERSAAEDAAPAASPEAAAPAPDAKSIAVLPFADMSPRKDQEYMSDGIAEELLNLLAKVPDLKVIARTSSFAFKGEKIEIAEIATRLNVAHVLQGSVRKSGNTVRITAQLVRTSDSTQLWSERYDRPLDDIFAVQDEIAGAIAQALQIRLSGGQLARREGGTQNLAAYELYLRALNALDQNTESSLDAANEHLDQAIKLDPSYGRAWMLLANTVINKADNGFLDTTEGYERARRLLQRALKLSPDLAEAHAGVAYIHLAFDWDWRATESELRRALEIDPANPLVLNVAGKLSATLGRWNDAEREFRLALVRDPLDSYLFYNLGHLYYLAGRLAESETAYRTLLELEPDFAWTRAYLAKTLLARGKAQQALETLQRETDEGNRLLYLPVVLQSAGRVDEAAEALEAQVSYWAATAAFYIAQSYAYRGEHDLALEWLERAYKQRDPSLIDIVGESLFNSMLDDPRFKAFLRKMKLPERPGR